MNKSKKIPKPNQSAILTEDIFAAYLNRYLAKQGLMILRKSDVETFSQALAGMGMWITAHEEIHGIKSDDQESESNLILPGGRA